jgi:uncharacterized protein
LNEKGLVSSAPTDGTGLGAAAKEEAYAMFESQQNEVAALMRENLEFRRLYLRHQELDRTVHDAEIGVHPMDDFALSKLKKEKLHAKDKLTSMMDAHLSA